MKVCDSAISECWFGARLGVTTEAGAWAWTRRAGDVLTGNWSLFQV